MSQTGQTHFKSLPTKMYWTILGLYELKSQRQFQNTLYPLGTKLSPWCSHASISEKKLGIWEYQHYTLALNRFKVEQ